MKTAELILFPNMRVPFIQIAQFWWSKGYLISNRRQGGYLLKKM